RIPLFPRGFRHSAVDFGAASGPRGRCSNPVSPTNEPLRQSGVFGCATRAPPRHLQHELQQPPELALRGPRKAILADHLRSRVREEPATCPATPSSAPSTAGGTPSSASGPNASRSNWSRDASTSRRATAPSAGSSPKRRVETALRKEIAGN